MMRNLFAALIVCISAFSFSVPAHAWWTTDLAASASETHQGRSHVKGSRYTHYAHSLGGNCAQAAALGGPCGCIAMQHAGLSDRKFWTVRSWFAFPRTEP